MKAPIRYSDDLETVGQDEAETIKELNDTFDTILTRVAEDEGHAYRSVHAKSHGFLQATMTIPDDLPAEYAQGIFAAPGTHPAVLRISTNPGDLLNDSVSVPRGMAIKVLNVSGPRLPGSEDATSQDFVMANGPVFSAPDADAFLKSLKLLARTTDRAEWAKTLLSKALRGVERVLEATTGPSPTVQTMGGAPNTHPLGETYHTQTAYRFGDHVAKLQLVPVAGALTALTGQKIDTSDRPDALREEVDAVTRAAAGRWELRAQLLRDPEAQPVEDATTAWEEDVSPFRTVAILDTDPQPGWTEARARTVDDGMRFSPWIGIAAHRPLGSINRARNSTYKVSAQFRERVNGCPIHDPQQAALD